MTRDGDLFEIATQIVTNLSTADRRGSGAVITTPILAYGHTFVPVHINTHQDGTMISDAGFARREANMIGGDNFFAAQARKAAAYYGVDSDSDLFFTIARDASIDHLTSAVAAVANASKAAIEGVMQKVAETSVDEGREVVIASILRAFPRHQVLMGSKARLTGAREQWDFDAVVQSSRRSLAIEIVSPFSSSVTSSFAKFSDLADLQDRPVGGVGVLLDKDKTPRLKLISKVADILPFDAVTDQKWRELAHAA